MKEEDKSSKIRDFLKIEESSPETKGDKTIWRLPDGKIHRKYGPAVSSLIKEEWFLHGKRHRDDGPAVTDLVGGTKEWWINDSRHRCDGPAVESENGSDEFWIDGKMTAMTGQILVLIERLDGNSITPRTGKSKCQGLTRDLPKNNKYVRIYYYNEDCESPGVYIEINDLTQSGNEYTFNDSNNIPYKITIID